MAIKCVPSDIPPSRPACYEPVPCFKPHAVYSAPTVEFSKVTIHSLSYLPPPPRCKPKCETPVNIILPREKCEPLTPKNEENRGLTKNLGRLNNQNRGLTRTGAELNDQNRGLTKNWAELNEQNRGLLSRNSTESNDRNRGLSRDSEESNEQNRFLPKNFPQRTPKAPALHHKYPLKMNATLPDLTYGKRGFLPDNGYPSSYPAERQVQKSERFLPQDRRFRSNPMIQGSNNSNMANYFQDGNPPTRRRDYPVKLTRGCLALPK
ncbi:uncharacterized protein LOC103507679 isoform X1 [Diaphorina citri]|uniref:Uncharacterized protein LOC103507679 isoform X1 n=1 Tax=Diaphorina citri TaxID=121845 RepID=A0A1S3CZQ8_DIACI|nr:uncharacterized protein LOC103507679 isoform X2 [Diaphorina citri]XP_008470397.1 uncharacterized protein LOC103507679 isoform X1 [Diaphorina citri]